MRDLQQLSTPPSSKASQRKSSESSFSPAKKGLLNKILRKKSASQPIQTTGIENSVSLDSGSTTRLSSQVLNRHSGKESGSLERSERSSNDTKTEMTNSSETTPTIIVDEEPSMYNHTDYDDRSKNTTDDFPNYSDVSSLNSSLARSISVASLDDGGSNTSSSDSITDEKFRGTSILSNNLSEIIGQDFKDDEDPWHGLTSESLLFPKYIRTTKKNKHSPRILNSLFLAQELNINGNTSTANENDFDTISSESLGYGSIDDDSGHPLDFTETDEEHFFAPKRSVEATDKESKGSRREIYVMEFSRDGKYLAAAGSDSVIRIWKVISSPLGRLEYKKIENENREKGKKSKANKLFKLAPIFHQEPVRVLKGHSHSVLSLDWSKNNFLLSGSMDRTVKLWHIDRQDCLETFQHEDFVTAVKFHPNDDRFFLSGALDNQARLWSILERNIGFSRHLGDDVLITALSFTPDGEHCVIGGFNGSVFSLETKGLHVLNRFEIKDKSLVHPFHNKNGNKITGIKIFENSICSSAYNDPDPLAKWNVLITTNDSRIRLINSCSKKLVTRFKGLTNNSSSIIASVSDDHGYIISGSEDHSCYVWENNNTIINNKLEVALKDLVLEGKDHINDLHHKHKKYLKLLRENKILKKLNIQKYLEGDSPFEYLSNENSSYTSFHAHNSNVNVAIFAPENTKKLLELSDDIIYDLLRRGRKCKPLNTKSPSRSKSNELFPREDSVNNDSLTSGHIIVTTDQFGLIRVFRQDSAYEIRKRIVGCVKHNKSSCPLSKNNDETRLDKQLLSSCESKDANKCPNLKLDLHNLNNVGRKLTNPVRGLSPCHENHFKFKNKIQNKIKSSGNISSASSNAPILNQSSIPDSPSKSKSPVRVSSSSLINVRQPPQKSLSSHVFFHNDAGVNFKSEDSQRLSGGLHKPESGSFNDGKEPDSNYASTATNYKNKPKHSPSTINSQFSNNHIFHKSPPPTGQNGIDIKIPLIIQTKFGSESGKNNENSDINFRTPINDNDKADDLLQEKLHDLKLEPSHKNRKPRGRKR